MTGSDPGRAHWDPDVQTLPRPALLALQLERVNRQIARAFDVPVPFFRRKLEAAGVTREGLASLDDLQRIPLTVKQELRESEEAHPPYGDYRGAAATDCVRLATTTGTTGRPTTLLWTRKDLEIDYEANARNHWRTGARPGDRIYVTAHPGYLNGGEALVRGAMEYFGFLTISVGPPEDEQEIRKAIELFRLVKPTQYRFFPGAWKRFYEAAKEMGLDPEADLGLIASEPDPRAQYRSASAGADAFPYLGTACAQDRGAHMCDDLVVVESVDPATGRRLPAGERGHLVVTTLERDNFVIRYDLEDVIHIEDDPCPCGETSARVYWHGRAKDVVRVGDRQLLPIDVELAMLEPTAMMGPATLFQLVRRREQPQAELVIRIEPEREDAVDKAKVNEMIAAELGVPVAIEWMTRGSAPRASYKTEYVVEEG
ncbi:MAG: phenylacetate--CoA ligase family protein [Actinomycetota bacterium]